MYHGDSEIVVRMAKFVYHSSVLGKDLVGWLGGPLCYRYVAILYEIYSLSNGVSQVLISIQSMILCDEPYLNEPAWAGAGGSAPSMACKFFYAMTC